MQSTIQSETIRVQALQSGESWYLRFDTRRPDAAGQADGPWRTILGSGLIAPPHIWTRDTTFLCEDPLLEWYEGAELHHAQAFFHEQTPESPQMMVLSGSAGSHQVTETIEILGPDHVHISVTDVMDTHSVRLGQWMTHLYFIPDQKASRSFEPLDFAWLPALHKQSDHVCADHFFRSPAVMVAADPCYAALVPDLDLFARYRSIPHALDLRTTETMIEAPRLSYGICPATRDGHVYFRHTSADCATVAGNRLCYGFDLFFGASEDSARIPERITAYLWERYGRQFFQDIRPQVLPFGEYGRKYTYAHELPASVRKATVAGRSCAGIHNAARRGANFHAWENDLHTGYGIRYYAGRWKDPELGAIADGILNLSLSAPLQRGAFPCVYNFDQERFEGTLYWTARSADPFQGYDSAAMSVSAWWQLYWFEDFGRDPQILRRTQAYCEFLKDQQLPSGAIPTYFFADLTPARQLLESATTAISGAVLAKVARLTGDPGLKAAALLAGQYVRTQIAPGLNFNDFEAYYSCSPKPLHAIDYWTGIRPHCNLSLQWACDQFLELYHLSGEPTWLEQGEALLSILSLYQQVWKPSHFDEYLYGGFGVMNTDAEWNDGRQARFVSTYADYYAATGKLEYLERAVAACRASFALMDIPENHANGINAIVMRPEPNYAHEPEHLQPGLGYAPENSQHDQGRARQSWTGLDWSSGGALAASAYLDRRFGALWVDCSARTVVPIDGLTAQIDSWDGDTIVLSVQSALQTLPSPDLSPRSVRVKFGRLSNPTQRYTVVLNGQRRSSLSAADLEQGLTLDL